MGIFNHHDGSSSANHTCPTPSNLATSPEKNLFGSYSFQQFNMILSGACTAFASLVVLALMFMHATHFSRPSEQSKILKICSVVPLYTILSFLSIAFPNSFVYLEPWLDLFQAVALASFFLLLCQFISPDDAEREMFFTPLTIASRKANKPPTDGLTWYRRKWVFIFQYPVVSLAVAILTCITQAAHVYCLESSKPYFAHLWLNLVSTASLVLAVMAVLQFYMQLKHELQNRKPMAKLLAFKLVIGLTFIEKIIFWILRSSNTLQPSDTLTYADVNQGIQTMLVCIEMVPISLFYHYAYDVKLYLLNSLSRSERSEVVIMSSNVKDSSSPETHTTLRSSDPDAKSDQSLSEQVSYHGGFLGCRAWLSLLNPMEIIHGVLFIFRMRSK